MGGPTVPLGFGKKEPPKQESDRPSDMPDVEAERVLEWRLAKLEERGVPYPVALELAMSHADVTRIAEALDRGMPVDQVEAIYL